MLFYVIFMYLHLYINCVILTYHTNVEYKITYNHIMLYQHSKIQHK